MNTSYKITPILIEGLPYRYNAAFKILSRTKELMSKINGIELDTPIFFSPDSFEFGKPEDIQTFYIDKMDYRQYNEFVLMLYEHLPDTNVLLCQGDGFPIDVSMWNPRFLEYDYIGAPWQDNFINRVGNGGFSFRSSKFIKTCYEIFKESWINENEDLLCCVYHYEDFIKAGIKYAPPNLAAEFSIEHPVKEMKQSSFGFHGHFIDRNIQN